MLTSLITRTIFMHGTLILLVIIIIMQVKLLHLFVYNMGIYYIYTEMLQLYVVIQVKLS